MANDTTGLFKTVLSAATGAASQILQYKNAFIDAINWDYQAELRAEQGQAITIVLPTVDEGDVVDSQGGPYTPTDTRHSTSTITLDKDFTSSYIVRSWDQVRTRAELHDKYFKPRLEALVRKVNRTIAEQVTSTNFNSYSVITGSGADLFNRSDFAGAWKNLAAAGVPVDDEANMAIIMSTAAFGNMLGDSNFFSESIVGISSAEAIQKRAMVMSILGAKPYYDQHLAKYTANREPAILMHRLAISGVTVNPLSGATDRAIIFPKPNLPVLVEVGYSIKDRGYVVGMTCQWGLKVTRPDFASLVETA